MRQHLLTLFTVLSLLPLQSLRALPGPQPAADPEPDSGSVVCPPGVYTTAPDDCVPLGPAQFLTQAAATGIPYPTLPLPSFKPDSALNDIPYHYFKVDDTGTPLYQSLQDAEANHPSQVLAPGFLYVSYQQRVDTDQGVFYLLRSGAWIAGFGARAAVPTFQGLQFSSQPRNPFGWVLGTVKSRTSPGLNGPDSGNTWYRYQVVQIYATQKVDNITWNLVAPNEWIDARYIGRVDPHTDPPQGVTSNRWIEVNLFEQTLSVYDNNQLVFATLVASGAKPFWTRPGVFKIYEKDITTPMSGSTAADKSDYYYLEDVPFTMYFDEKRALHGAYWHNGFGYPRSHGCVNLSIGDSHWLFNWANIGDFVYVYDPSGQTPTDASSYGAGAP
ncbi:MAG TPA: L,D-transpeptidase [Anaerolineales bacterium]|nr:L,D-transpeptidase [Anaerolineales bacterium]